MEMISGQQKLCIKKVSLNLRYFHEYFNDISRSSGFFGETIVTPENSSSEILTCFENFIMFGLFGKKVVGLIENESKIRVRKYFLNTPNIFVSVY